LSLFFSCSGPRPISGLLRTEAQEINYAYHEDRLLLLIARKSKLPACSDQIASLDAELISVGDLVRSYRLVRTHEHATPEQYRKLRWH
jgi:hypothetical protein